jgi:hypothetical protein
MEKHEIAAILSDTRYFTQNENGDRIYDIEWQFSTEEKARRFQERANEVLKELFDREFSD